MRHEAKEQGTDYLRATLLPAQDEEVLEVDEVWSFVKSKKHTVWLWVALCRRTRQVVAWMWGDRGTHTCQMLWDKVPPAYKKALCYSDFWQAYQQVIPPEQHHACAKKEGQTAHIERFFLSARNRLGRLTRKTLSFSKRLLMHLVTWRLFLVAYNIQKAKHYKPLIMA